MKDDKILDVSDETRKAVEPVFREYHKQVFNYVKYVTKNHEDAKIVTSDVFAKIMNLYGKPETRFDENRVGKKTNESASLSSWVRTVTNSVVLDFFRTNHQHRFTAVSDFVDSEGYESFQFSSSLAKTPEKIMENEELKARLLKAFRGLKPKYRKIATLYFIKEQSYDEIADVLDIPMGTVKGTLSRARNVLQNELNELYILKKEAQTA